MSRKPQYQGPWKKVRLTVLDRDHHQCQIRGPGCTREATEVDHILPAGLDPHGVGWFDVDNLRAACKCCNLGRNIKAKTKASRPW